MWRRRRDRIAAAPIALGTWRRRRRAPSLQAELERGADRIAAAVPIAKAIIDGRKAMAGKLNMPNLAGVTAAFDKFRHGVEMRAQKLTQRIEGEAEAKADGVFKRVHGRLDEHLSGLDEIETELAALDNSFGNGGPSLGNEEPAASPPSSTSSAGEGGS